MNFDIVDFLEENNIDYVTHGPNVARGNVNIMCPWCVDDPSHHLGINIDSLAYGCWRNTEHRGRNIAYLIAELLGCNYREALGITGANNIGDDFMGAIQKLVGDNSDAVERKTLKLNKSKKLIIPEKFRTITRKDFGSRFVKYLVGRGFSNQDVDKVIDKYDLRYCMSGSWGNRIIFPIRQNKKLATWIGRSILPNEMLRYKTLTVDPDKEDETGMKATLPITDTLFNYDELIKRTTHKKDLYVVEGPFDAIKIDYYGEPLGIRSTCLFTNNITDAQKALLEHLAEGWNLYILMDDGAYTNAHRIADQITWLHPVLKNLPGHVSDPGEMSARDVEKLL